MTEILGAVLAGGRSLRFGSDKALANVGGKPMIQHTIDALARITRAIIICGRQLPGYASLPDRPAAALGPLGGLNAALHEASARRCPWVLTVACDTPVIPAGVLQQLADGRRPQYVATQPVIGLWPSSAGRQLDEWIASADSRSMRRWAEALGATGAFEGADIPNFNYADALDRWLATPPAEQP